jgi:hypothetical protein
MATYLVGSQPRRGLARPSGQFSMNLASPQARGLIAWFPCVSDVAPRGPLPLNVSASGTPTLSGAAIGGLALTGANSNTNSLEAAFHPAFASLRVFTVSAWVRWDGDTTSYGGILTNYNPNPGFYFRRQNGGDKFQLGNAAGSADYTSTTAIPSGRWAHVLGTIYDRGDGFQNADLYLDGRLDSSTGLTAPTGTSTDSLRIANDYVAGSSRGWGGQVADIRLYGRGMVASEVWTLYDPQTRWDLYWQPSARVFFDVTVGGGSFNAAWARGANVVLQPGIH